ncbi:MAG: MoxR family ATPase [Gammaproteobacteria bacterium]|nr:MoxR family ATPase [Gammaproteobacteria bacterium]
MTVSAIFKSHLELLNQKIIGQQYLTERMFIALLADGHLLVEGAPGLAKTTAIKELSQGLEGDFHRIQFTPDLLPADLTGTEIYRPQDGSFIFQKGPLFHNLLLADEINRAPAKVQSALLEAMGERQITVGGETYPLPQLFLVMATQNPIEQEGTYPLPEAQLDRFLMHINIGFPDKESEKSILRLVRQQSMNLITNEPKVENNRISQEILFKARQEVLEIHMAENLEEYLVQLVMASREAKRWSDDLHRWIRFGVSPRATIALDRCARAHAWLNGRDFVSPDDIQTIAPDVMRHRILLTYEAEAEGIDADRVVREILNRVPVP